jgi:hypothetical protein
MKTLSLFFVCTVLACAQPAVLPSSQAPVGSAGNALASAVDRENFADLYCHAWCDELGPCCDEGAYRFELGKCLRNCAGIMQYADPGANAEFDATAATRLIADRAALVSACSGSEDALRQWYHDIEDVFLGTLPPLAECVDSDECATPKSGSASCQPVEGLDGNHCVQFADDAPVGAECHQPLTSSNGVTVSCGADAICACQVCAPLPSEGSACYSSFCAEADFCSADNKCEPRLAEGKPCAKAGQCTSDAYCDSASGRCSAKKGIGKSCDPSKPGNTGCRTELFCDHNTLTCAATHPIATVRVCLGVVN